MELKVIGAGLPCTGTHSQQIAREYLLKGRCFHMREIPGHPLDLGEGWNRALAGDTRNLNRLLEDYVSQCDVGALACFSAWAFENEHS